MAGIQVIGVKLRFRNEAGEIREVTVDPTRIDGMFWSRRSFESQVSDPDMTDLDPRVLSFSSEAVGPGDRWALQRDDGTAAAAGDGCIWVHDERCQWHYVCDPM